MGLGVSPKSLDCLLLTIGVIDLNELGFSSMSILIYAANLQIKV